VSIRSQLPWILLLLVPSCQELNPTFDGPADGGSTSSGATATATMTTTADEGSGGPTGGQATGGGSSEATTTPGNEMTGNEMTGTGDSVELGFPCMEDAQCDASIGAECCTVKQCEDTCMVPCDDVSSCPEEGMGCEHGYCLFPCDNDDADCEAWPGYACKHGGGALCEL
jgi:hypothetical protein